MSAAANTRAKLEARQRRRKIQLNTEEHRRAERVGKVIELADKVEDKRKDMLNTIKDLKSQELHIESQRRFLGAAKSQVEETHFQQLMLGAERQAKNRQKVAQEFVLSQEKISHLQESQRILTVKKKDEQKKAEFMQKEEELRKAKKRMEEKGFLDKQAKKAAVQSEILRAKRAKIKKFEKNLYAAQTNQELLRRTKLEALGAPTIEPSKYSGVLEANFEASDEESPC